jgi:hypothetical protein
MTSFKEITYNELYNSSEKGLRGELNLWEYNPSEIISKEILINMLMIVYFGELKISLNGVEK